MSSEKPFFNGEQWPLPTDEPLINELPDAADYAKAQRAKDLEIDGQLYRFEQNTRVCHKPEGIDEITAEMLINPFGALGINKGAEQKPPGAVRTIGQLKEFETFRMHQAADRLGLVRIFWEAPAYTNPALTEKVPYPGGVPIFRNPDQDGLPPGNMTRDALKIILHTFRGYETTSGSDRARTEADLPIYRMFPLGWSALYHAATTSGRDDVIEAIESRIHEEDAFALQATPEYRYLPDPNKIAEGFLPTDLTLDHLL